MTAATASSRGLIKMCNTVPNVIKQLGYKCHGESFTRQELLTALVNDGYGVEKAQRRVTAAIISHQIIPSPIEGDHNGWISVYCPLYWERFEKELEEVVITPVSIGRDNRPIKSSRI